jgi:hypothetical protein
MKQKGLVLASTVLMLWAFFAQCVTSMVNESPTVDEQAHLMRGYVYLELGDLRFKIGHPVLANAFSAIPVWALMDVDIPLDQPSWQAANWSVFADRFVWQPDNPVSEMFLLGRLSTVGLGLAGAALLFRWARQWSGARAGVIALVLFVFDPNVLAHSRLVTDDVAVMVFGLACAYGLWRTMVTGRARFVLLSSVMLGLAEGAKYSALVLLPALALLGLTWGFRYGGRTLRACWRGGLVVLVVVGLAALTLWAGYGFQVGPLMEAPLGIPVPAPDYVDDLLWQLRYSDRPHAAFLMGRLSSTGWWYYDLVALSLKSSLALVPLFGLGMYVSWRSRWRSWELALPVGLLLAAATYSRLDIGVRYLLPLFPFLYLFVGQIGWAPTRVRLVLLVPLLAWVVAGTAAVAPHYLAYFNELAGGPSGGYRYLVDSNLDWGQDLPGLRAWQMAQDDADLKLSYFGTAHPSYYDLDFEPLPMWDAAPEQGSPFARTYYPRAPAPGIYAISVTALQGIGLSDPDTYAWFREQEPLTTIGHSIHVYRVSPVGPPVDVTLSGIQIDQVSRQTFAFLESNDVRIRWFESATSLVLPAQPAWYVLLEGGLETWGWEATLPCALSDGSMCQLYPPDQMVHDRMMTLAGRLGTRSQVWQSDELVPSSSASRTPLALPAKLGNELDFLGYEVEDETTHPGTLSVLLAWRVMATPRGTRSFFVHLLSLDGQVLAQWDGMDVASVGWREGDTILQIASLELPSTTPSGDYWLQVGVYDPGSMARLLVLVDDIATADRILLEPIHLGELP